MLPRACHLRPIKSASAEVYLGTYRHQYAARVRTKASLEILLKLEPECNSPRFFVKMQILEMLSKKCTL